MNLAPTGTRHRASAAKLEKRFRTRDNSVSSFGVGEDGRLTLLDVEPTGNAVEGRSGTAKSLAYAHSSGTLIVLHSFGPNHVRLMSVHAEGKLTARPERYTVNTHDKPNRVPTMVVVSPGEKFVC